MHADTSTHTVINALLNAARQRYQWLGAMNVLLSVID